MPEKNELPEGWAETSLGNLIKISSGKYIKNSDYSKKNDQPYPVAGAGGPIGWTDKYNFEAPIIVLGRVGAAGSLNVYHTNAWVTDNTLIVEPFSQKIFKWVINFFQTVDWNSIHTGSSQPLITQKIVKSLEIPLPPLPEQHRIVSAIEAIFSRLDAAEARLERVPEIMKHFRQSVLAAACDGRLTEGWRAENPEIINLDDIEGRDLNNNIIPTVFTSMIQNIPNEWKWIEINSIALSMKNGIYKPSNYYSDDGFACLRMYNIENGKIVWKDIKRMKLSEKEIQDYLLKPGDLLVNRVNSRELVGKAAPIPENIENCVYESKNIRLRPDNKKISTKYLGFCFQLLANQFFNINAQQTVGMASINQNQLGSMPIPLPPLPEQNEIVRRVDALFALADRIEEQAASAKERTEKLRQSVLAQAFSGRLVETEAEIARREGRSYESAGELLVRIRDEVVSEMGSGKKVRQKK